MTIEISIIAKLVYYIYSEDLADTLLSAFLKGAGFRAGRLAADAVFENLSSNIEYRRFFQEGNNKREFDKLTRYICDPPGLQSWSRKVLANAKLIYKNNVLVLGPSGAGKTQFLYSIINPEAECASTNATAEVTRKRILGYRQYLRFVDTPGLAAHSNIEQTFSEISGKSILVLLVAGGRLENASLGGFRLPNRRQLALYDSMSEYINAGLEAELHWLQDLASWLEKHPCKNVSHLMIVINRAEVIGKNMINTLDYYQGKLAENVPATKLAEETAEYESARSKEVAVAFKKIAENSLAENRKLTFHPASSYYDAFPRKTNGKQLQEHPQFGKESAVLMRKFLRAEMLSRIDQESIIDIANEYFRKPNKLLKRLRK